MQEIQIIEKEISIIREKYLRSAIDILSDYNNENKTKLDYKGRQIYELLQNADDCYTETCPEINVKFELRENILIVQNNGNPFDSRGIISLMHQDASSKHQGTIGCKGLGFRAVLNWANKVSIYTESFNVSFSEKSAIAQLQYYKDKCDQDHVQELDRINRIAILNSAEVNNNFAEKTMWLDAGFSTAIVLHCDPECVATIQKQLVELQFEELLFLKHVRNIQIISPEANRTIEAVDDGEHYFIQEGAEMTDWTVWRKAGNIIQADKNEKAYELVIAYNNDESKREFTRKDGVLYSYFKTEIPMPFPFLVHGTFELTSERNGLIKESANNEALIDCLIDFIGEKGAEIAERSQNCDYTSLKFLLPAQPLYFLDKEYDFTSKLKSKIKAYKLFPTISEKYISVNNFPYYSSENFASYVSKQTFNCLLKHCDDPIVSSYISELGIGFYSDSEFVELLNKDADEYVAHGVHDKLITLYFNAFPISHIAPKLLVDSNGKRMVEDNLTIFNNDENRFDLPKWCEMRFINYELEKKLLSAFNCNSRRLMEILCAYGCKEYSFDSVVRQLISQCNNDKDKSADLLNWLFRNWCDNNFTFKTALTNVNIKILSRDGNIVQSSQCYFGKEYENPIGERIVSCLGDATFVADVKALGLDHADMNLVKKFLSQLGVKEYPQIEKKVLNNQECPKYLEHNAKSYYYLQSGGEMYDNNSLFYQSSKKIQVADITGIDNILEKADYRDIICWILTDNELSMHIRSKNEIDDFSYMFGYPYKKKDARYIYKSQMISWLRNKFIETAWLPVKSGKRVNCSSCTMTVHSLSPIVEVLDVDCDEIAKMLQRPVKKEIDALFEGLGVAEDIVSLPKETIYNILLQLPILDKDCILGKDIYTNLNLHFDKEATSRLVANNSAYRKFLCEGKVLAKVNGRFEYCPINEVYYVGKSIYSGDILRSYPILALNRRAGDDKVAMLFGVQSIKKIGSIKVTPTIHRLNDEFQIEYQKLLPYIYAKRLEVDTKNKELNLLKNSKIFLVEEATTEHVLHGELKIGKLCDYELIYTDKIAYIKVPRAINTLLELKSQIKFASAAAEVITNIIDVDKGKDAYIFIFESSIKDIEIYFQDNDEVSLVNLAKEKFSQYIDLRYEFWRAIANALSNETVDSLQKKFENLLPNDFDYKKINDTSNAEHIIELFKFISIDIDVYNETAFEQISLKNYFNLKWCELKSRYKKRYLCYIAEQMSVERKKRSEFDALRKRYELFEPDIENSVNVNLASIFEESFDVQLKQLDYQNENYDEFYDELQNDEVCTGSYAANTESAIGILDNDIDYVAINKTIAAGTTGKTTVPNLSAIEAHNFDNCNSAHKKGGMIDRKINVVKEIDGFIAESKVYNTLLKKISDFGYVEWISGNGCRAGQVKEGDDSCGYDIRYADAEGKLHYVEVKSTSSNSLEFILTKNEFNFAQQHKEQFELWFVFINDGEAGDPYELGKIFMFEDDEDFFHNHRFSVEQTDYKLKAKINKF